MKKIRWPIAIACAGLVFAEMQGARASGDLHRNYPAVPSGSAAIVRAFGQPCSADAQRNATTWRASDDLKQYPIRYHARLGGSFSTNLHDVIHHIKAEGLTDEVVSGIYGYACRRKRGDDSEWSVHAWGVAFDIATRYEHVKHQHCHALSSELGAIWRSHRWTWGRSWGDCMHFQYATGY